MDQWLPTYAEALGVPALTAEEEEAILDLARDVAHGTERKNAPLAAYLAGRAAATAPSTNPTSATAALAKAQQLLNQGGS